MSSCCHLISVHGKGKCDRLQSSTNGLEKELSELRVCKEALERQYDEEAGNCRFLKVPSTYLLYNYILICVYSAHLGFSNAGQM